MWTWVALSNLQSSVVLQVQASAEQAASKLSLAEMQMVELRAQRLEGLQVCVAPATETQKTGLCVRHHDRSLCLIQSQL